MFNEKPVHDEYFGGLYAAKNLANQIMPGRPFPNIIHTARLFRVGYGQKSFRDAYNNYHTDMIPFFGQSYLMAGVLGFLPLLFFTGTMFSMVYCFYSRHANLYFQRVICLYMFYFLLFTMGLDTFLGYLIFFIFFGIVGLRIFMVLFRIMPSLKFIQ